MLEDQEVSNKKFPLPKRPRYQEMPNSGGSNFKISRNMGSSAVPISRYQGSTWHRGIFSHRPQSIPFPCPSFTGKPWCPKCNRNHVGNCVQGKQCFTYGKTDHRRRECPILHGYPRIGLGTGRQAMDIVPFPGPSETFRRSFDTP